MPRDKNLPAVFRGHRIHARFIRGCQNFQAFYFFDILSKDGGMSGLRHHKHVVKASKKHRVFIDNEFLTVKGTKELTQKIKFCDVKNITLDHGVISKVGGGTAFSINLFNDDYSQSVNISNPSFFMVIEIIKKCKNAKVKFNNWKWYIISSILFALFCILLCLFGLSGN